MKNNKVKLWTGGGIICVVAMLLSVWYAITLTIPAWWFPWTLAAIPSSPRTCP